MKVFGRDVPAFLIIIGGILCFIFTDDIHSLLPYFLAAILLLIGLSYLVDAVKKKDLSEVEQGGYGFALVYIIVGIGVLIEHDEAIEIVGIFWGIYGLRKAAIELNELLHDVFQLKKPLYTQIIPIIFILVGGAMSAMIIFDPETHAHHHIILLGFELLYEGIVELYEDIKEAKQKRVEEQA